MLFIQKTLRAAKKNLAKEFFLLLVFAALLLVPMPVAAAITTSCYSSSYDCTLFAYDATYGTAQGTASTTETVEYTTTTTRCGQDNATAIYYVYRTVWAFNTSVIPARATITTATLSFYGQEDQSDADFLLYLTEAGDIHSPPEANDYNVVRPKVTTLANAFNTSTFSTAAYNVLTLTAAGISKIDIGGTTVFALRSYEDITSSAPAGQEWIDIWSSESAYPPKLNVTYTVADLGTPDKLEVKNVAIFTNYMEPGDQVYCFTTEVNYTPTPTDLGAEEYFAVQLINGVTVEAQTPVKRWGMGVCGIYLDNTTALAYGGLYTLKITGTDMFTSPPSYSYTIVAKEWRGYLYGLMDMWVESVAKQIGVADAGVESTYLTSLSGKTVVNDAGTEMFTEGIPYINTKRPEMFSLPGTDTSGTTTVTNAHSSALYATIPAYFRTRFDTIMPGTIPGYWIPSVSFAGLAVAVIVLIRRKIPGSSTLSYVAVIPVMGIGFMFGVPIWIAMVACTIALLAFGAAVFLQRT